MKAFLLTFVITNCAGLFVALYGYIVEKPPSTPFGEFVSTVVATVFLLWALILLVNVFDSKPTGGK